MTMSPGSSTPSSLEMVSSTNAAGTMIHTARGFASLATKSSRESAPVAPSLARSATAAALTSHATHS